MSPDRPTAYEWLTRDQAAQIDAVCDRFEQAWKKTRGAGPVPCVASYLGEVHGPLREALLRELTALDRACREHYGLSVRPGDSREFGTNAEVHGDFLTRPQRPTGVSAVRPADWPSIPGLELLEVLGAGGMGVVFRARQATLDRDVAVKFLRDAHRTDWGQRERFVQEARAVARLRHPHLVQVYEFGEVPAAAGAMSQPYLVLEYVSGGSLADLLRRSPQPPREAAQLVETLAEAIHYAHQQGVIHRDLKPGNILLSFSREPPASALAGGSRLNDMVPKITDFGLARLLAGSDLTRSGDVLGTPSYMAPEQAASKSVPITEAVDVYGLGAILYEAVTGRPPFTAASLDATLALVRHDEPVPPRRLQPTVPRDLEIICLKCLRKEANRRYGTAQDLANDLRRFQTGEPIRARPVGTAERLVVWCRRNPGVAALLAALVLVFLAGSTGVLWQWQLARRNAAEAQQNAALFRRERDTARQEKERADHHLHMVRERVSRLERLGQDLWARPGQYRTGQAVLEEALAFYQDLLPEEGNDPAVRREAAKLFGHVAWIHHTLGQAAKAAEAWERQASVVASLLQEEPDNKTLRLRLADIHRWRGNMLRDAGKTPEARQAYDQAAELHEALSRDYPAEPAYQVALANTLLNTAGLLSHRDQADEREKLHRRIVELDQAAVRAAPDNAGFRAELALALAAEGHFCLESGRSSDAETALQEALEIYRKLLADGHAKGSLERYVARNLVHLARVRAAAGRTQEAEQCYQEAVHLLERLVEQAPEYAYGREELAGTLNGLADFLQGLGRGQDAEEIRRRLVRHCEALNTDFPENPQHRRSLGLSHLELARLLAELGRPTEADEARRKALNADPESPDINNNVAWFLATGPEASLRDAALAVRLAQKAVSLAPQVGDYRNTLGVAHYRNGDDKTAVAELETSMGLRRGGDSFDWFFLAMAHGRLGDRDQARTWFDRAVEWMDKHRPKDEELRRFRAEAEALLADAGKGGPEP